jgi:amino acid transporter
MNGSTLWNFQGFDALGSIAGEVKNGKVTYPLGAMTAIFLIALFYVIPIMGTWHALAWYTTYCSFE